MPATFELIAPCFFGCESTAGFELRRLGAEDLRVTDGRLTFRGGADLIAPAIGPIPLTSCLTGCTPSPGRSCCLPTRPSR